MVMHGFGEGEASESPQKIGEIAAAISKVPGVIWVHHVERSRGKGRAYSIIFEFGHWNKYPQYKSFDALLQAIQKTGIHDIDVYTIKGSYKG